jgi:Sulfatase
VERGDFHAKNNHQTQEEETMKIPQRLWLGIVAMLATWIVAGGSASAQTQKPNILVIMGDDIGWMQPGIYHRGLMVGETPNIDRIGNEGAMFVDYTAMQSCTSPQCLLHWNVSAAHRHDPAAAAG